MEELPLSISGGLDIERVAYRIPKSHIKTCSKSRHQRVIKKSFNSSGVYSQSRTSESALNTEVNMWLAWSNSEMYVDMKLGSFYNA